jgi:hypothetical protein
MIRLLGLMAALICGLVLPACASEADGAVQCERPANIAEVDFGAPRPLSVFVDDQPRELTVRLADTPAEHARGLMWVAEMADDEGMIFLFPNLNYRSFWMENTCIALDLIFLDERGYVVHIAENAEPFSREQINSQFPARGVLEVNGGLAAQWGLERGDRVYMPPLE